VIIRPLSCELSGAAGSPGAGRNLPVDPHLKGTWVVGHIFATVNSAAESMGVQPSLQHSDFGSFR
jgi:hypothetical protein